MSTSANEPTWLCPACGERTLIDHCRSKTCEWHRCLNRKCGLVADLKLGIGHCAGVDGRVRWHPVA